MSALAAPRTNRVRKRIAGIAFGDHQLVALRQLATWPNGTGPLAGTMNLFRLRELVLMKLADRVAGDQVDGERFRINDAGRAELELRR